MGDSTCYRRIVTDTNLNRLSIGLPVQVRISDDASIAGSISQVLPSIENGFIAFFVNLEQKSNRGLHSNQRVDIDVFTERKANALQIKEGPGGFRDQHQRTIRHPGN